MKTPYIKGGDVEKKLFLRSKDNPKTGCLEWIAGKDRNGYGRIWHNQQNSTAHTVAYERWIGTIPENLHVRHSCDNPACINPEHLVLGTHADNMKDKSIRKRVDGEKNPNAKFTDEQRKIARQWKGSPKELSQQLGMSEAYICNLRKENMSKFS